MSFFLYYLYIFNCVISDNALWYKEVTVSIYLYRSKLNNTVYEKNPTSKLSSDILISIAVSKKYLRVAKYLLSLIQSENKKKKKKRN